jgi:protein-S-isoprenylcysteine O-methyltransferase Ste14
MSSPWWYRHRGTVIGVLYGLGFALGNVTISGHAEAPVGSDPRVLWVGVASAIVAWLLRASGTAYLRRDVVFAADVQRDKLIVAGPFRHVRNPLYLGNVFLALAMGVLAPPLGFVIIAVGNVAFGALLAAEESREMAQRYGDVYGAFKKAVPAFIPRLTAATVLGSVSVEPLWGQALLGEAFCLTLGIAIVPIALFGSAGSREFWVICIATFVCFGAWGWWSGRARSVRTE